MDRHRRTWETRHRGDGDMAAPSPFVVRALELLGPVAPAEPIPRALDLASGRGRHALLLAEHGYAVDAVDFARPALAALQAAARMRALAVQCLTADVTTWPLPPARYALIVVVNFLDRALLPSLLAAVAPGGALLYETHRRDDTQPSQHLRSEFLLRPGELDDLCRGWHVLLRHDRTAIHDGRLVPRAGILARRPVGLAGGAPAH
jgi:SAM-dependent methyltransferase